MCEKYDYVRTFTQFIETNRLTALLFNVHLIPVYWLEPTELYILVGLSRSFLALFIRLTTLWAHLSEERKGRFITKTCYRTSISCRFHTEQGAINAIWFHQSKVDFFLLIVTQYIISSFQIDTVFHINSYARPA